METINNILSANQTPSLPEKAAVRYLIAGQGLAGTILAHTFIKNGHSVMLIDDPSLSKASRIAAGLYNPVVFKRLVKSWMADELIPSMDLFYTEAEAILNIKCYHQKVIVKLFAEENEKEFWLKKTTEEVGKYLSKTIDDHLLEDVILNPLGGSEVIHAGNLDTKLFLDASRDYFLKKNMLMEEAFDFEKLRLSENEVQYKNMKADKIIFCEGHKATVNPYFNWLPFKLTKGETLTIRLPENKIIPLEKVINKGVFILPLGNNSYKVGATYEWNDLTEEITEKGKNDLSEKLKKILKVPFEIISQQAGIRPTVNDRRPLIGIHPEHKSIGIFNGLGTKGVMLAPYFAQQFVDLLEKNNPLNKEVDINRFYKKAKL